jgi:CRP/FNR family cyclic AMP-dependent transcriptional regulator
MNITKPLLDHIRKYIPLAKEEEAKIASRFGLRSLRKNELLIQRGSICQYEHYVVSGTLRSFYTDEAGIEHTLQFATDDWWITDLESFTRNAPAEVYAEALEPARVLQITKHDLDNLYNEVRFLDRFFRMLHERAYIAQNKRILNAIRMDGLERYQKFIADYPVFHERVPQKYIASYLGITPVFLSQIRRKLAANN